jgi:hypothetical protein
MRQNKNTTNTMRRLPLVTSLVLTHLPVLFLMYMENNDAVFSHFSPSNGRRVAQKRPNIPVF